MIKKVMNCLYTHISNLGELFSYLSSSEVDRLQNIINNFSKNFNIIKYNKDNRNISLMYSSDWESANEPTIDISYTISPDGTIKTINNGRQVYHNKWQFVSSDYKGFDVEKSKQRTKDWNSINDINSVKSKIGNKSYWINLLKINGLEV